MTAATLTITDFLLARIAEDEAVARACLERDVTEPARRLWEGNSAPFPGMGRAVELLNNYTPHRVLAECAAFRQIVEEWRLIDAEEDGAKGTDYHISGCWQGLYLAVCALASIWADHPEFDEEWR